MDTLCCDFECLVFDRNKYLMRMMMTGAAATCRRLAEIAAVLPKVAATGLPVLPLGLAASCGADMFA